MARTNRGPRIEYNRQRGVYEIRWTDNTSGQSRSRRLSTGTANLAEAQAAFAGWLNEWQADQGQASPYIRDLLDAYLAEHVGAKVVDKDRPRYAAAFMQAGFGDLRLEDLDQRVIDRYVRDRKTGVIRGRSRPVVADGSLRRELGTLIAALNHAARQKRISADDIPYLVLPEGSPPAEFWLTEDEADALLDFAARESAQTDDGRMTRVHRYLVLGLGTAARMGAILSLRWSQVDRAHGLIRYDVEDGRRTGGRGNKRRVPVPIADWLRPWLDRMHDERLAGCELVMDHDGQVRRAWESFMRRAARDLDNPRYLGLNRHALRHTAATHMARAGVDLWQLAGVLGDSLATVMRTYAHHQPDHLRSAVNATGRGQPRPAVGAGGQ